MQRLATSGLGHLVAVATHRPDLGKFWKADISAIARDLLKNTKFSRFFSGYVVVKVKTWRRWFGRKLSSAIKD